jgi:CRP-like cAMP-binding protein
MQNTGNIFNYHIFSGLNLDLLPTNEKKIIDEAGTIIKFKKNDVIYNEGSNPRGVYLIINGMVKVNQINTDGREQILFFLSSGELFGYRPLLSNDKHPMSAVCIENCEIKFIDAASFMKIVESSITLTRLLLTRISHEFTILVNLINIFAQKGIRGRLAFALLVLNEKYKSPNSKIHASNIKMSRTNIAAYIGSSIDVVSRNLKHLSEIKVIRVYGKSIHIIDFDYLLKSSGLV